MWKTMDEATLKGKKVAELREIAKTFGLAGYAKMKKADLIAALMKDEEPADKPEPKKIAEKSEKKAPAKAEKAEADHKPEKPEAEKAETDAETRNAEPEQARQEKNRDHQQARRKNTRKKKAENKTEKAEKTERAEKADRPEKTDKQDRPDKHEKADKQEKPEKSEKQDNRFETEGILDLAEDGFGFLRFNNFLTSDQDIYVSPAQIRRFNLKTGDKIRGICRPPSAGNRFGALLYVVSVNGDEPGVAMHRPEFESLTPIFPDEKLVMEEGRDPSLRPRHVLRRQGHRGSYLRHDGNRVGQARATSS